MTWVEFIETINRNKKFVGKDDETYEYDENTQKNDLLYKEKVFIRARLACIFPLKPDVSNDGLDYEDLSDTEVELFLFLHECFPGRKTVGDKTIITLQHLRRCEWEYIPIDERKKLLRLIKKLDDSNGTIKRYMSWSINDNMEKDFEKIKIKILHPEYYRIMKNLIHLAEVFSDDYETVIKKFEKSDLSDFEQSVNKLLIKYGERTNGVISPYSYTDAEIDRYIDKNSVDDEEKDLLHRPVYEVLIERESRKNRLK